METQEKCNSAGLSSHFCDVATGHLFEMFHILCGSKSRKHVYNLTFFAGMCFTVFGTQNRSIVKTEGESSENIETI